MNGRNFNPAYYEALSKAPGISLPAARTWSILLTSANHGTVGPVGSTFPHAGEKHERVQVIEIVEAGAPPAPGVDLAGLVVVGIDWSSDFLAEVRANGLEEAAGLVDAAAEGSLRSATAAAIRALKSTTPTATNTAGAVPSQDFALRSRVADLLRLLEFATIETPSPGDADQAKKAMRDVKRMLDVAPPFVGRSNQEKGGAQ